MLPYVPRGFEPIAMAVITIDLNTNCISLWPVGVFLQIR